MAALGMSNTAANLHSRLAVTLGFKWTSTPVTIETGGCCYGGSNLSTHTSSVLTHYAHHWHNVVPAQLHTTRVSHLEHEAAAL